MDPGCHAVRLKPFGQDRELVLVQSTDAIRLCHEGGYEAIPTPMDVSPIDAADRQRLFDLREFLARAKVMNAPLAALDDHGLLMLVRNAIRRRDLVVIRATGVATESKIDSAGELRRLVKRITQQVPRWDHGGRHYKLVVGVDLHRVAGRNDYEVVPREDALRVLGGMASASTQSTERNALLVQASSKVSRDWRPPLQPDGLVLLRRIPVVQAVPDDNLPASTPSQLRDELPIHWVEFRFQDKGGRPLAGIPYVINLPDGTEKTGKLNGQGGIRHESLPSGRAQVTLADITQASWSNSDGEAHLPVDLTVATRGMDDGTAVHFEIFRLYRERPGDVVAELDGAVDAGGIARVRWQPDAIEKPDGKYVFKASVAGLWRKSGPLRVAHRVGAAAWSGAEARGGDAVTLRAELQGVKNGESAVFTIYRKSWHDLEDPQVEEITASVTDGVAEAEWTVPTPEVLPARVRRGQVRNYLFFVVEVGKVHATSGLLTVVTPPTGNARGLDWNLGDSDDVDPGQASPSDAARGASEAQDEP